MTSLASRERAALCDTALQEGPDAPTLCEPWEVRQLVCHLLVRERNPIAASGIGISALAGLTDRAMAALEGKDFAELVARLRRPPVVPYALPGLDRVVNTLEFWTHHEDIRRAREGWQPRRLDDDDESTIWSFLRVAGRGMARGTGVPVRIDWGGRTVTLRGGDDPVVVRGLPSELALVLQGRQRVALAEYDGPAEAVERVRHADLGV